MSWGSSDDMRWCCCTSWLLVRAVFDSQHKFNGALVLSLRSRQIIAAREFQRSAKLHVCPRIIFLLSSGRLLQESSREEGERAMGMLEHLAFASCEENHRRRTRARGTSSVSNASDYGLCVSN